MDKGQPDGFESPRSPIISNTDNEKIRSSLCSLEAADTTMLKDDISQISKDYSMEDAIIDSSGYDKEATDKYSAYSSWRKRCIVAIVSLAHLISPVSGMSFLLALNPMREVSKVKASRHWVACI